MKALLKYLTPSPQTHFKPSLIICLLVVQNFGQGSQRDSKKEGIHKLRLQNFLGFLTPLLDKFSLLNKFRYVVSFTFG